MDVKEFYELINEPPSVFVDSLFTLVGPCLCFSCDFPCFDAIGCNRALETRRKGELEFSEFVETIALYCTFGREDILKCET